MNIGAIILIILGLCLILLPARYILKFDNRIGYQIYIRTLNKYNDEEKAFLNAGIFYKLFGLMWILYFIY